MDLVDVFAVPAEVPPPEHHWGNASHQAVGGVTHPWDSIGEFELGFLCRLIHYIQ